MWLTYLYKGQHGATLYQKRITFREITMNQSSTNEVVHFDASVNVGAQPTASALSKYEIERTRIFFTANVGSAPAGSISNAKWTVQYKSDGTGILRMEFTETVKIRLIKGKSTVALTDEKNTVLSVWDVPYFRECGAHSRSFERTISAEVGEKAFGLRFEVDGDGRYC